MGLFDKVREALRDKTIDKVCAGLRSLGIDAQMAEHSQRIDILEGPIAWINARKETEAGETDQSLFSRGPGEGTSRTSYHEAYHIEYGVPDRRLLPIHSRYLIMSVRVRTPPLFGEVSDLHWKGQDFGLGIIDRLDSDISLKQPIMQSCDVTIRAHGDHRCWTISTKTVDIPKVPSGELWTCYQAIARHLLSVPLPL